MSVGNILCFVAVIRWGVYTELVRSVELKENTRLSANNTITGENGIMNEEVCNCTRSGGIDEDIQPIVAALNSAGIKTISSCCGHTFQPTAVCFEHNGVIKEMRLFTFEQSRIVDKLFPDVNGKIRFAYLGEE